MKNKKSLKDKWYGFVQRHANFFAFIVTFVLSALIFGIIAAFVMQSASPTESVGLTVTAKASSTYTAPTGSFTMLISVSSDSDGSPVQLMLYRLDSNKKETVLMPISPQIKAIWNNSENSLSEIYKSGGICDVRSALSQLLSIHIDYCCNINSVNFIKIFNSLGGIYCGVPQNISIKNPDDSGSVITVAKSSRQYLSGAKIYALIASNYSGGILEQLNIQATVMKEFLSEKMTGFYLDNFSKYYDKLFNYVETDFSLNKLLMAEDALEAYSGTSSVTVLNPSYSDGLSQFEDVSQINKNFE